MIGWKDLGESYDALFVLEIIMVIDVLK